MHKKTVLFSTVFIVGCFFYGYDSGTRGARRSMGDGKDSIPNVRVIEDGDLKIFTVQDYSTTIVRIPQIDSYIFSERPSRTMEQIAADSGYSVVMNASFFDIAYDDPSIQSGIYFKHAGYLKINDSVVSSVKIDRQLSRFFAYNSKNNIVDYFPLDDLEKTARFDLVIQTGPQIIWKNIVDTISIHSSINGSRRTSRTAFASVNNKEFYFIVTSHAFTLTEFGTLLRSSHVFGKDLAVIDFDGGGSTRIYIKNHPELSIAPNTSWPVVICAK